MSTKTPLKGYTVPSADGSDDPAEWPEIGFQMGVDIENGEFITTDSKHAADLYTTYPPGVTVMGISPTNAASLGWPTSGTLVTINRSSGGGSWQLHFSGTSVPLVQARSATATSWSAWYLVAGSAAPVAQASGTYTFDNISAPASATIAFPSGRFTATPTVQVSSHDRNAVVGVTGKSTSGFTLLIGNNGGGSVMPTSGYSVEWTATQTN